MKEEQVQQDPLDIQVLKATLDLRVIQVYKEVPDILDIQDILDQQDI
jgi:hypothetical protein